MNNGTKIGIFCDVPSLWYAAKNCGKDRVDYKKLLQAISHGREVAACNAYLWHREGNNGFYDVLKMLGYKLTIVDHGKDVKPLIAHDAITTCLAWDTLVLAAGEGDYTELFKELSALGKQVELRTFPSEHECDILEYKSDDIRHVPLGPDVLQSWSRRPR